MFFDTPKLTVIAAGILALLATDVRAQESDARQALNNRELAAAGLAISVTVRGEECGSGSTTMSKEGQEAFREFFGSDRLSSRKRPVKGSGTILTESGEIVSLAIEESCESYEVSLPDGRVVGAQAVGFDSETTLILLQVEADGLTAASIGDPNDLQPGDEVLAVGSPFDMTNTISKGVVSMAKRRLPGNPESYYIHTDAMINPGHAGGPLLNEYGDVVGLHALLLTRSGKFDGMSFALPIDMAMRLVEDIREFGEVRRGLLGIDVDTPEAGVPGALVTFVDSDAAAAGVLQENDLIVSIDGVPSRTGEELGLLVRMYRPGDSVSLSVVRGEETLELAVTLGERPNE